MLEVIHGRGVAFIVLGLRRVVALPFVLGGEEVGFYFFARVVAYFVTVTKRGELFRVADVEFLLCRVDLEARHYIQSADVKVDAHNVFQPGPAVDPVPNSGIELLAEIDYVSDEIVTRLDIEVSFLTVRVRALGFDGHDVIQRHGKLAIPLSRGFDYMLVIRKKHGVRVEVTAAELIERRLPDRINHNDFGGEIHISVDLVVVNVDRQPHVAHRHVRAAGAYERLAVFETDGMYMPYPETARSVELPDRSKKHLYGIADHRRVVAIDQDMSETHVLYIRAYKFLLKVVIQSGLREPVVDPQHREHNVIFRNGGGKLNVFCYRILDMMTENRRVGLELYDIIDSGLQEIPNLFLIHLHGIQKLVVGLHHRTVEEVGRLLVLDHSERRLDMSDPTVEGTELEIFDRRLGDDELYILYPLGMGLSVQLRDFRYAVIGEELLKVTVEAARLKELVPQEHHTALIERSHRAYVYQSLPVPDTVLYGRQYGFGSKTTVLLENTDTVFSEFAFIIIDDEYVPRVQIQRIDNRGRREAYIALKGGEVNGVSFVDFNPAHLPFVHTAVEPFVYKQALTDTGAAGRAFPPDIMNTSGVEAVLIQMTSQGGGLQKRFGVLGFFIDSVLVFEVRGEHFRSDGTLNGCIKLNTDELSVIQRHVVLEYKLTTVETEFDKTVGAALVEFANAVLKGDVYNLRRIALAVYVEGEVRSSANLLVDFPKLDLIQGVVQSAKEPAGVYTALCVSVVISPLRRKNVGYVYVLGVDYRNVD